MARPDLGCCCSGGGGSGDVECCGESGNCNSPPANKYHKQSITLSFKNKYPFNFTWTTPIPAGANCETQGGLYPARTTITQGGKLGVLGGINTRSVFPCGPSTDCHNGELIPNTDPDEYVPGDCPSSTGCVSTCLPYEWETCCVSDTNNQPNCGQLSFASINEFQEEYSTGKLRFTVKAVSDYVNLTAQGNGGYTCTGCGGCPGFERLFSADIPDSFYIANTNNQEVVWGVSQYGGRCPANIICREQGLRFYCADAVRNWDGVGSPSGGLRYFDVFGRFSPNPPVSSLVPYIELDDYPGSILATLSITHEAVVHDELLIDNGWGSCGFDGGDDSSHAVFGHVGYVAPCGTTAYTFSPFGSVGTTSNDGTMCSRVSSTGFSVPHDTDDWTN